MKGDRILKNTLSTLIRNKRNLRGHGTRVQSKMSKCLCKFRQCNLHSYGYWLYGVET